MADPNAVEEEVEEIVEVTENQENTGEGEAVVEGEAAEQTKPVRRKKLFIGKIDTSTTEEQLKAHFEQFGVLHSFQLMKKKRIAGEEIQGHRGFAFVTLDKDVAEKVMEMTHEVEGNTLSMELAKERTIRFYVGGFNKEVTTKNSLTAFFEGFGEVKDCFLANKGFAFVTVVDEGENLKPLLDEERHTIDDVMCRVQIAKPESKQPRRERGGRGGRRGGYQPYGQQRPAYGMGGYGGGMPAYGGYGGYGGYPAPQAYGGGYGGYNPQSYGRRY